MVHYILRYLCKNTRVRGRFEIETPSKFLIIFKTTDDDETKFSDGSSFYLFVIRYSFNIFLFFYARGTCLNDTRYVAVPTLYVEFSIWTEFILKQFLRFIFINGERMHNRETLNFPLKYIPRTPISPPLQISEFVHAHLHIFYFYFPSIYVFTHCTFFTHIFQYFYS